MNHSVGINRHPRWQICGHDDAGWNPHEEHRGATPLELLYDLTFVVAFGQAGSELAHLVADGHVASGLIAFGFANFAICWCWINFSWFASAAFR